MLKLPHFGRANTALILFICFLCLAFLAAVIGVLGFTRMSALNAQLRNTAELRNNKIALVQDMVLSARGHADLLLTLNVASDPEEKRRAHQQYPDLMANIESARSSFLALKVTPEESKLLDGVLQAAERLRLFHQSAQRVADETGLDLQSREQVLRAITARQELETSIGRLLELQRTAAFREVADASELNQDAFRFALLLQAIALAVSVVVGVAVTWLVSRSERQLKRSKEKAQATLNAIDDGVITVDGGGLVQYMNPRAEALTGWRLAEARKRPLGAVYNLVSHEGRRPVVHPASTPSGAPMFGGEGNLLLARDGREYEVQDSASAIRDEEKRVAGAVLVFRDLTDERKMRRELEWHSVHDRLTGLNNREEFERQLAAAIQQNDSGQPHALLFLDLDQFSVINNTCGHVGGDQLLCRVAEVLRETLRSTDVIARLGGDDFAVLLRNRSFKDAFDLAEELCRRVRAIRFTWQDKTSQVTTSIGVVAIDGGVRDPAQIMGAADIACYAAKEAGRDCVMVHHPEGEGASRMQDMGMVSRIQHALDTGSFTLYRQRIQGLHEHNRDDRHYEMLVRMIEPDGRVLPPGAFLPAAERYNLMRPIDRWVVQAALAALQRMNQAQPAQDAGIHTINLSGATINDSTFSAFLGEQLALHGVQASSICFEITETMAISNLSRAASLMHDVKAMGCKFAIDDFGIGMSSFAYLKHLPVDYLKIDGAFIRNILRDQVDYEIVDAIARICRSFNVRTIAEFVEEEAIMPVIAALGVDYAQGYAVGKPLPLETV